MIDWNRVTELRNEVGADAFEEVISLFIEEVDDMIGQLRTMTDRAKLMDDLHLVRELPSAGIEFSLLIEATST